MIWSRAHSAQRECQERVHKICVSRGKCRHLFIEMLGMADSWTLATNTPSVIIPLHTQAG